MDAVILAAGRGKRVKSLINDCPKCMISVGGQLLIERLISDLLDLGISKIIVCIGYGGGQLVEFIRQRFPKQGITFVYNPFYRFTNNSYSLWLARYRTKGGFLLINGDNLLDKRLISQVMSLPGTAIPFIQKPKYDLEDMKVELGPDGYIRRISKQIQANIGGESIGIRKVAARDASTFWKSLNKVLISVRRYKAFYTEAFQKMIEAGYRLPGVNLSEFYYDEIDTESDFQRVNAYFQLVASDGKK